MNDLNIHFEHIDSPALGHGVEVSLVMPHKLPAKPVPLLIFLHGGGQDRHSLVDQTDVWRELWASNEMMPLIMASFSAGIGSFYVGAWETFVVNELPAFIAQRFDIDRLAITGVSMGGCGALRIAFKHPKKFAAVAAVEPAIEPSIDRLPDNKRNTWWRPLVEPQVWGDPVDAAAWRQDHPAFILHNNAEHIRNSGLEIYLEAGDTDYLQLHDGAEYLHRIMWSHDIRHEYHHVRWADHVGLSLPRRVAEAHRFASAALNGGLEQSTSMAIPDSILAAMTNENGAGANPKQMLEDPDYAPTLHRQFWEQARHSAEQDSDMKRAYAKLRMPDDAE